MQLQLTATPPATQPVATPVTTPVPAPPVPTRAVPAGPVPVTEDVPAPVADATFAQKLLGKIGSSQQRAIEGQQLLGAVSTALGQRLSMIGSNVWRMLRGTPSEAAAG